MTVRRVVVWLGGLLLALLALLAALYVFLDTAPGHRFLIRQIERQAPESGLRIRVGRIEGSIYGRARLRGLELHDPQGRFFVAPVAMLDWSPLLFVTTRTLDIDELTAPRATWERRPALIPSAEPKPLLPDFDIRVADFRIDRLTLAAPVAGRAHVARLAGRADVRAGRLMVKADAALLDGAGDRLALDLDSYPDANRFRLSADVVAPRGGVIGTLAGIDRALAGTIRGTGDAGRWTGRLLARDGEAPTIALADLALRWADGRVGVAGTARPDLLLPAGLPTRLTAGGVALDIDGTIAERRFAGRIDARARALTLVADGGIDLARNRFDALRVEGRLARPEALLAGLTGRNVAYAALLDGSLTGPRADYRVTADTLAFGRTSLSGVTARGIARSVLDRWVVPIALTTRGVSGQGPQVDPLLRGLAANGTLTLKDGVLTSNLITLRTDRLTGRAVVLANFRSGTWNIGFDGALPGYEIPGLGRVDLVSRIAALPGPGGLRITGRAEAIVRRLDNGFFATVMGGLPRLETGLAFGPDGVLRLPGFRLTGPALTLAGDGYRRADGRFVVTAAGRHREYGPVRLALEGEITRPRVTLVLARPYPAADLRDVRLSLVPVAAGYGFTTSGQSTLGPFTGTGTIILPRGRAPVVIDIARLTVAGTTARGRVSPVAGGLAGRLDVSGGGVTGTARLAVNGGVQDIFAQAIARNARFPGPPAIALASGRVDARIRLLKGGPSIDAAAVASGFERGGLSIARLSGTAKLVAGRGTVRLSLAGTRGRPVEAQLLARVTPDAIDVEGRGRVAGRPVRLVGPASLRRRGDGWALSDATLAYADGTARVEGLVGGRATRIEARVDRVPLSILDILYPAARFGGRASGTVTYADAGDGVPTGSAAVRISGLTRGGLGAPVRPVDIGLNAALDRDRLALRAVAGQAGGVSGRLQLAVRPLGAGGGVADRILRGAASAQLRFQGPAETLWALTGVDALSISGPLAIGANVTGTLADPTVRGLVRLDGGRIESVQAGTVLTNVKALGRFAGPRLDIVQMSAATKGGGAVSGIGRLNLDPASGFPYDLRLTANRALLLERDDFAARVTGPLRLMADADGGLISGDVRLDEGKFELGRASAANALPVIQVREVGRRMAAIAEAPVAAAKPFRLAIRARGDSRLKVTGLGLESDWATNVTIGGTVGDLRIGGEANLVRGDYTFAGRRFELETGRIRFMGRAPIDPVLDIRAVSDVTGIDATILVRGTGQKPEISFASIPALPQDELLSRILFGASITDISVAEAAQLAAAVASLQGGGGGLDPINALRKGLGLDRLRILPADSTVGQGTSIAAGKYLTRRIFVEIITDGQGYSATRAEFQITRWLSILSAISTVGRQSVNVRVSKDY